MNSRMRNIFRGRIFPIKGMKDQERRYHNTRSITFCLAANGYALAPSLEAIVCTISESWYDRILNIIGVNKVKIYVENRTNSSISSGSNASKSTSSDIHPCFAPAAYISLALSPSCHIAISYNMLPSRKNLSLPRWLRFYYAETQIRMSSYCNKHISIYFIPKSELSIF